MFYINVAVLLVNSIVVSYLLNFISSYIPRKDNIVNMDMLGVFTCEYTGTLNTVTFAVVPSTSLGG